MHIFTVHIDKIIFHSEPVYSNLNVVNCANYTLKTGHFCKWPFSIGLIAHSVRKPNVSNSHINNAIQKGWHYGAEGQLFSSSGSDSVSNTVTLPTILCSLGNHGPSPSSHAELPWKPAVVLMSTHPTDDRGMQHSSSFAFKTTDSVTRDVTIHSARKTR